MDWLKRSAPVFAASLGSQILSNLDLLESHPRLGRMVPRYEDESIRELIVGNYRVVYLHDVDADVVRVAAIVHGSQDIYRILGRDPWERP